MFMRCVMSMCVGRWVGVCVCVRGSHLRSLKNVDEEMEVDSVR